MGKSKEKVTDCTIKEFCERMGIGPAAVANACGVEKQYINNIKTRLKHPHVVRYDEKTGDIQIVKVEKIMCHGNLNRKRQL